MESNKQKLTPNQAWEKIKNLTSTHEQGFSIDLKDDPYYKEYVELLEKVIKAFEILNKAPILWGDIFYKMEEKKFINHEDFKLLVNLFD